MLPEKNLKKKMFCIGLMIMSLLLFNGCAGKTETKTGNAQKGLPQYLVTALPDQPYACAELTIKDITTELGGTADISWKTFATAQELQEYIAGREDGSHESQAKWLYYQCELQEDYHAIDLYNTLKCYDRTDCPLCAVTSEKGAFYRFSQEFGREILVRDNHIYGLAYLEPYSGETPPAYVQKLLDAFVNDTQEKEGDYLSGQVLDEEKLYWLDHESRKTVLENPNRTFTEVRAIDAYQRGGDRILVRNFGMLYDAAYEITFPDSDTGIQISFQFEGNIPATGYETFLMEGDCSDETYVMRVTDLQTGNLLQIEDVILCLEETDTLTFQDWNGDGFPDMKIERPVHLDSSVPGRENFRESYVQLNLWNPDKNKFDLYTGEPVQEEASFYAPVRELSENAKREDYCVLTDAQGELYIPKDFATRSYVADGRSVYIAQPDIVKLQNFDSNEADFFSTKGTYIQVCSTPTVNKMGENALTQDWEHFVREVTRCSELCEGRVYNLNFERYHVEGGSDLYGYTFDFDADDCIYEMAVFIRLEKVNMIEMIGFRKKMDNDVLKDVMRYLGASFIDYGGEIFTGYCKMEDIAGADEWDYPQLHNLFSWAMDELILYAKRPDPDFPDDRPVSFEEPEIERAVRRALEELWRLDDDERRAFEGRPLMMSDLAVITRITCIRTTDVPSVLRIRFNRCLQEIEVAAEGNISYRDLANFSGLKVLEMEVFDLADYAFVGKLTKLQKLKICASREVESVDFLGNLRALRSLMLGTHDATGKNAGLTGFNYITDLSPLENCNRLAYLYLCMPKLADFSFLENMPEIETMVLEGEGGAIPDLALLPNAEYRDFYGKFYRNHHTVPKG